MVREIEVQLEVEGCGLGSSILDKKVVVSGEEQLL